MALTFEYCRSCGGRTQIDPAVAPEDRRCLLCGESCSEPEETGALEIPSAAPVDRDISHRPAELLAENCPHCEADIAVNPDLPLWKQRCHACGRRLQERRKRKTRKDKHTGAPLEGVQVKPARERVWMPMAGTALAVVIAAIFAIWMMHRPEAPSAPAEEVSDHDTIKELVRKFNAARSPEELLPLIRDPARFEKPMRAWCAAHPGALPLRGEFRGMYPPRQAADVTLRQVGTAWPDAPAGLLLVAKTAAGWQVDWRAFMGTGDLSIEDFLTQKPASPAVLFAVVRRSDYYNGAYADSKAWLCLHVTDREGGNAFYAYAPRNNPALIKPLTMLPPGGRAGDLNPATASRRMALRLVFKTPASAELKQAEVTAVEGDGWYLP